MHLCIYSCVYVCAMYVHTYNTFKVRNRIFVCMPHVIIHNMTYVRFRNVKLRGKNPTCSICGSNPTVRLPFTIRLWFMNEFELVLIHLCLRFATLIWCTILWYGCAFSTWHWACIWACAWLVLVLMCFCL